MIRAAESQRCMSGETAETAQTGGDTANRSHIVRSRVVSCSVLYGVCSHLTLGVRAGVVALPRQRRCLDTGQQQLSRSPRASILSTNSTDPRYLSRMMRITCPKLLVALGRPVITKHFSTTTARKARNRLFTS
jgi:hypothetical protein